MKVATLRHICIEYLAERAVDEYGPEYDKVNEMVIEALESFDLAHLFSFICDPYLGWLQSDLDLKCIKQK